MVQQGKSAKTTTTKRRSTASKGTKGGKQRGAWGEGMQPNNDKGKKTEVNAGRSTPEQGKKMHEGECRQRGGRERGIARKGSAKAGKKMHIAEGRRQRGGNAKRAGGGEAQRGKDQVDGRQRDGKSRRRIGSAKRVDRGEAERGEEQVGRTGLTRGEPERADGRGGTREPFADKSKRDHEAQAKNRALNNGSTNESQRHAGEKQKQQRCRETAS